jgi:hypothetical protein
LSPKKGIERNLRVFREVPLTDIGPHFSLYASNKTWSFFVASHASGRPGLLAADLARSLLFPALATAIRLGVGVDWCFLAET